MFKFADNGRNADWNNSNLFLIRQIGKLKSLMTHSFGKAVQKQALSYIADGNRKMVQFLQRRIWQYLPKLYVHLLFDSEILFLGIYPEDKPTV